MQTTASVYDPAKGGINGNPNATPCGVRVADLPWSIAHKSAPCGSIVTITNGDQIIQVPVADRGPYVAGRDLDLRPEVAAALGDTGLLKVNYAIGTKRVNLHTYAQAGGNAAAFEKLTGLVANSKDKLGTKTDQQYQPPEDLLGTLTGGATTALKTTADAIVAIVNALFDPSTYLRLGKGLLGGVLVVLGVGGLVFMVATKVGGSDSVKGVKKVAEAAAVL